MKRKDYWIQCYNKPIIIINIISRHPRLESFISHLINQTKIYYFYIRRLRRRRLISGMTDTRFFFSALVNCPSRPRVSLADERLIFLHFVFHFYFDLFISFRRGIVSAPELQRHPGVGDEHKNLADIRFL